MSAEGVRARFTLYVYRDTLRSNRAIATVRRIGREVLEGRYELSIVDLVENPEVAEREGILSAPTLVKEHPPPMSRLTGDLSDRRQVLDALDLL